MKIKVNNIENNLVTNGLQISGDVQSVSRCLRFSYVFPVYDDSFEKYQVKCGDKVEVLNDDNEVIFYGMVYHIDYATAEQVIQVECYDLLNNLLKSKFVGRYRGTLNDIVNQICSLFGLENGINSNSSVIHNILSTGELSYYDVLCIACKSLYGDTFNLVVNSKTLLLKLHSDDVVDNLEIGQNIINSSYSSDISNMVNKILIVETKTEGENTSYKIHGTVQNDEGIKTFGLFQNVFSYEENSRDNVKNAKAQLVSVINNSSLLAFGNDKIISGSTIHINEPKTKTVGKFVVESDSHTYNVTHTVQLGVKYINE